MFVFTKLKNGILVLLAVVLTLISCFFLKSAYICRFSDLEGTRVFYLYSASSQGLRKERLSLQDITSVRGESVRFIIEDGENIEKVATDIVQKYNADLLFCEEACGVTLYYCYTELWSDFIVVNGYRVNLHIAISENTGTVGSPIIFDGF